MIVRPVKNKKQLNEWFDQDCSSMKTVVNRLLRHYRSTGLPEHYQIYRNYKLQYLETIDQKQIEHKIRKRKALVDSLTNPDQKHFWRLVNPRKSNSNSIEPSKWVQYFTDLYLSFLNLNIVQNVEGDERFVYDVNLDSNFSVDELRKALAKLKCGKAGGMDGIPGEFWKYSEMLLPLLLVIFNHLYRIGYYPEEWKVSIIVPLYKKGDVNLPDNYRGVALTSSLSKVFAQMLAQRVKTWLDDRNAWCPVQAGFRKDHSTLDNIFIIYSLYYTQVSPEFKVDLLPLC